MIRSFIGLTNAQKRVRLCVIGCTTLLCGLVLGYFTVLQPWQNSQAAQRWVETPCQIFSSVQKVYPGSKSPTYGVDISYQYQVDGQTYQSSQYDFTFNSIFNAANSYEIVSHYPPFMQTVCYVNPQNHSEAVLNRGFQNSRLSPVLFLLIALIMLIVAARLK
jgi:hypothetical protein